MNQAEQERRKTILVVDDERQIRVLLRTMLEAHRFRVFEASDGNQALEIAKSIPGQIDLLLTDIVMPGMDGGTLADRLLNLRPGLRVLYVSGFADNELVRERMGRAGAGFLEKPFSISALIECVGRLLAPDAAN